MINRESIELISDQKYQFRFVSNTTRKCRKTVAEQLSKRGFDIPSEHIFTPPLPAPAWMKKTGKHHCYLMTTGDAYLDFEQECTGNNSHEVDVVVVGDAGANNV